MRFYKSYNSLLVYSSPGGGGTLGISGSGGATGTLEDPNALIYIPYPRVNCLKTIPFTAAHTYIAHIWQYPSPPIAVHYLERYFSH